MYRGVPFVCLLVVFSALLTTQCGSSKLGKAEDFIEAGMYAEAISLLEETIQGDPKQAKAHHLLGVAFLNTGEDDRAAEAFGRASKISPDFESKSADAYHEAGNYFLAQTSRAGIQRGYRYLEEAINKKKALIPEISKTYRDKGIELARAEQDYSRSLLSRALELDESLTRDDEFYFALHIETELNSETRSRESEEFLSLFPESEFEGEVLYWLGDFEFEEANYSSSARHFRQLAEKHPASKLGRRAKERLEDIEQVEDSQEKAEVEKKKRIKQTEIERAEKLKQMEIEQAERLTQIELEKAEQKRRLEIWEANKRKEMALEKERKVREEKLVREVLEGRWSFLMRNHYTGYFEIDVAGKRISGKMIADNPDHEKYRVTSISGTIDGINVEFVRFRKTGVKQTYKAALDVVKGTMTGTFRSGSNKYKWHATKE